MSPVGSLGRRATTRAGAWNSAPRAKANDLGNDAITWYIASGILEVVGARPSNAILLAFALRG